MRLVREHKGLAVLGVVALIVAVLYATGLTPALPDAEKIIEDIAVTLGPWTYLLVGALAFLETGAFVGLVAPGESAVIVGGVVAGQGEIDLIPLIGLVWICAVLGDSTSFLIGRRLGRDFLLRHGPKFKIDEDRLAQVESYFERHGGKTILIGRFIGLVRALAPFVAGSSGLAYRRFVPFSVIGCGLWATLFCVLGYIFYRSFDQIAGIAGQATLALGVIVALGTGIFLAVRRLRRSEDRRRIKGWFRRQGQRPMLRPLARVLRPVIRAAAPRVRFIWERLTPGNLGIEFTSTLALAGVGLYVFVLYVVLLTGDTVTTPADRELLDVADSLRDATAVDIVKVVTELGSLPVVIGLVVVTGIAVTVRREPLEAAALVASLLLVYVAVHVGKDALDRPRPFGPLDSAAGSAFPSGHAAYSTLWLGAAVAVARVIPGFASRLTLVAAGFLIVLVVGLSRIYLRVHYWSDVAGGWGLGAGIVGGVAAVAIIVAFIRNNEHADRPAATP